MYWFCIENELICSNQSGSKQGDYFINRLLSIKVLTDFLKSRKQRVVLNGKHSSWSDALNGVPQGSILGPLLFLIHINDLSDRLQCNPNLFADNTSLFATMHIIKTSSNHLTNDLTKITKWAVQWKISFNPDISKQVHEVIQKVCIMPCSFKL